MQGENEKDGGGCSPVRGSPDRRCTSSADGLPGCSTVLIDSPIKSTGTSRSAPPALGARSGDGKTRRYVRSSEPRLKWTEELHQCFMRATAKLGGPDKATPKAILQEMSIRWLKIAHVKSHLQMYRNPKSGKSHSPQSDFSFWRVAQPEESPEVWNSHVMDKDCQVSYDSNSQMQAGNRHMESEVEASWRSLTRGAIQPPNMTNVESSAAREQYSSADHYSGCSLESPAHFNQIGQFGIASLTSDHRDESRVGDLLSTPDVIKDAYPNVFKMAEVFMESRTTKSRDFETLDDVDDRRQFLSDQILAGDADATRLYDSAEALAHNLLMAMRERKLLEAGVTQSHAGPHDTTDTIIPDVPLELTMSIGVPETNPDVRSEILTLDLTEQLNRPHL